MGRPTLDSAGLELTRACRELDIDTPIGEVLVDDPKHLPIGQREQGGPRVEPSAQPSEQPRVGDRRALDPPDGNQHVDARSISC